MKKIDEGAVQLNIKADRSQYGYVSKIKKVFCHQGYLPGKDPSPLEEKLTDRE